MAHETARQAMISLRDHERVCGERWKDIETTLRAIREAAARAAAEGSASREALRESVNDLRKNLASFALRSASWLITSLALGLAGAVWYIVTHPLH